MVDDPLQTEVQFVLGVGRHRAELLARLEIRTVRDLLFHLPRDVLDFTHIKTAGELVEDGTLQSVRGTVIDRDSRMTRTGKTMTAVLLKCSGGFVRGVWFNQGYMLQKFTPDQLVIFSGSPKFRDRRWEISHPRVQWLEEDDQEAHGGILPRYGLTEGLPMHEIRRILRNAVEAHAEHVPDPIPESFRAEQNLFSLPKALKGVHTPGTMDDYHAGRRRLLFEDLLEFQLGIALRRRVWQRENRAVPIPVTAKIDARIRRLFPFRFTPGQDRAVTEISADLAQPRAMHRLLQADVGTGKTAIAVYAMLAAVANGTQAVMMAPTEVLAGQHWQTVEELLAESRVERRFLTGQLTASQRQKLLEDIRTGTAQLIVGTQAIIQKDVAFQRLGMVVIDEQHKFGVQQRARFLTGDLQPHVLVMTATPIPRTLCLTQFGDLDVTTITDQPPGRQRIVTSRVYGNAEKQAWDFIRQKLREGRQMYVVCPRIGDGDADAPAEMDDPSSAEGVFRMLSRGPLREFRLGLVHGQMDCEQRSRTMDEFREGTLPVLVATTVIEVGVDVPNATMMVIYQAERFGLSQLHQLRGRIGRGKFQGYCFLFSESNTPDSSRRLTALEATADGFEIAEVDHELRGSGDVLGTRQHGAMPLRVANLIRDKELVEETHRVAFELVVSGRFDQPAFAAMKRNVLDRFQYLMDLPPSG